MEQLNGLIFLLLTVCIGYLAAAGKLLLAETADILPKLLFGICYPAMILETFSNVDLTILLDVGLPVALATWAVTLVLFLLGQVLFRRQPPDRKALLTFLSGIGNVTYVAIPVFGVFLSGEAVLAAIIHSSAQDPLIWGLYYPMLLKNSGNSGHLLRKSVTSPCLIATVLGILLTAAQIPLPSFIRETLSRISAATSPIALLLIGMLIRQHGFLSWTRDKAALWYGIAKVILLPCCLLPVLLLFLSRDTAILLSILFGSPAPLLTVAWARQHHSNEAFTIHCFLFSTLLYLVLASALLPLLTGIGIL